MTAEKDGKSLLLDVRDLRIEVGTRNGRHPVVSDLSFALRRGEALGVVGESGSGKSLTMLSLIGLLPRGAEATAGSADFEGIDLLQLPAPALRRLRGGRIGMIFQDPMTSFNPVMRIGAQIAEPLRYHLGLGHREALNRAGELMRLVGIPGGERRLRDFPHQLSGGMRQRAMIAAGIACNPSLLIADEPTTALDVTIQAQVVELVKRLRQSEDMSIIWITHDLSLVAGLVDRIMVLYSGRVVEEAPVDALYASPRHPYTRGLLGSLPTLKGPLVRRLPAIGGSPSPPDKVGPGCAFAPRCKVKIARCLAERPPLVSVPGPTPAHRVACWLATEAAA